MTNFAIVKNLPDVRLTTAHVADTWYPLTGRKVTVNKASGTSKLRITLQDTLGARATFHAGCMWRILVGETVVASFSDADIQSLSGWRMHNASHTAWAMDIPAGTHEVEVENLRTAVATDCLSGWNTTGNFLSVEEVP